MRPSQLRRAPWTLALGLPLTACGASITALYEGDVRFEHCMALDEESTAKASHRAACWSEWVAHYSYGQTRDRIDYAKRRARRLEGSEPEGSEPKTVGVGAPSSTHAPPPLIERSDAGAPAPAPSASVAPPPSPPGAACAAQCGDTWASCQGSCTVVPCERSCATKYRLCMKRCY